MLLGVLAGAGFGRFVPRLEACEPLPVERLIQQSGAESAHQIHRWYRAHAYLHAFSFNLATRMDVGGGYATVEEGACGTQSAVGLQFAGGSTEARAHGLNRVGLIQEAVLERGGSSVESAYFGFLAAASEKNLSQARKSLASESSASAVPYAAAFGQGSPSRFRCTVSHISVPARYDWSRFTDLCHDVRERLGQPDSSTQCEIPVESTPDTFLYSVRRAILAEDIKTHGEIVYNGKRYELQTEKQPDMRAGQQLAACGVAREAGNIWRLNGSLTEAKSRQISAFQLWFRKGDASGLPVRVEFYPRPYLRLVFEQQPGRDSEHDPEKLSYLFEDRAG